MTLSDLMRTGAAEIVVAMGGPFVPLPVAKDAMSFERQVQRVKVARAEVARFTQGAPPADDITVVVARRL